LTIDFGDAVAALEGVMLVATWARLWRSQQTYVGWRRKASFAGLVCASIALALDLVLTVILHFRRTDDRTAAQIYLLFLSSMGLMALCGLVLGILGRGRPRVAAIVWSCFVLALFAGTIAIAVLQPH
jgi:cytochrome bd-type quinol oxidase subunit 2